MTKYLKYTVVMVFMSSILILQLKYKIMYETLEHWNQYKQEEKVQQSKELFNECGFQYKEKAKQEMDKFINKLVKKNGTTKY